MNIKLTVYLTIILAIAIVAVVFIINPHHNAEKKIQDKRVFQINTEGIKSITITNRNGDFTLVKSSPNGWIITSPVNTEADVSTVNTMVSSIATLNYEKKIGNGDLTAFGLSPASITATVISSDNRSYTIKIGNPTPIGAYYYAIADNGIHGIFTINNWLETQLDANLFKLRDKKPLNISQSDLLAISFTKDSKPVYTLEKEKDIWIFTKPAYNRLKTSILNDLAFRLTNLDASNILDNVTDLNSLGLEKPSEVISILLMNNKHYTIKIGKSADQNSVYAVVSGKNPVYVINKSLLEVFDKPITDMIDRRLLTEDSFAISNIEINHDGRSVLLSKKSYNQWSKNGAPFTAVSDINDLLNTLTSIKAEKFIYNVSPLKTPAYTFTITGTVPPTTTTISLSDLNKTPVYAKTSIDPRLAVLNTNDVNALEKSIKSIYK
ncbi:MAG: DUF4340 domain-containing protein [bacterium]